MIVFLCFILLILILLLFKIKLVIEYNNKLSINIKYLFFNFDILSFIKKNNEKSKKEKKPPEKSKRFLEILNKIQKAITTNLYDLKKGIIINRLSLNSQIGIDDAKDTALLCGHIYNAINIIDIFIISNFKVKDKTISITPRFNEMVFELSFILDIKASLINLLATFILVFKNIKKN